MQITEDFSWDFQLAERVATDYASYTAQEMRKRTGVTVERKYDGIRCAVIALPEPNLPLPFMLHTRNWQKIPIDRVHPTLVKDLIKEVTDARESLSEAFVLDGELMSRPDINGGRLYHRLHLFGSTVTSDLPDAAGLYGCERLHTSFGGDGEAKVPIIPPDWEGVVVKTEIVSLAKPHKQRWVKFKRKIHVPCWVIGVEATKSMKYGAFRLASDEGGPVRYVGKVGTGFTQEEREQLASLIGEFPSILVEAAGWTVNGKLREPVYCPGSIRVGGV